MRPFHTGNNTTYYARFVKLNLGYASYVYYIISRADHVMR